MLQTFGRVQLIHQIPKDIEGNEVQISSTTSMLGRQLEDTDTLKSLCSLNRTCTGKPLYFMLKTLVLVLKVFFPLG